MDNSPDNDVKNEFETLGENLRNAINAAWQSDERLKAQRQIENGLSQIGAALNDFTSQFSASDAGKQVREEFDEFTERLRSGQVEAKARQELVKVLKTVNAELEKAMKNVTVSEEHPDKTDTD